MPHKELEGYVSVTQVTAVVNKPFLARWRGNLGNEICDRILREATQFGTEMHSQIELWLKGKDLTTENKHIRHMVENRLDKDFIKKYEVKPLIIEPEEPYKDDELMLQGTFDCIAEVGGKMTVIDWKSSNSLDPVSNSLQLSAYAHLFRKNEAQETLSGCCVRLDRQKDKLQVKFYDDLVRPWEVFKKLLDVYHYVKNNGKGNDE